MPYAKYQLVERPFAYSVPFSLATVGVMLVAGFVVAAGAAVVEKVRPAPRAVPASLVATRR